MEADSFNYSGNQAQSQLGTVHTHGASVPSSCRAGVSARLHTFPRREVEVLIWFLEYVNIYVAWFRGSTQNTNRNLTFLSSSPEIRLVGMYGCIALTVNSEGLTVR